MLHLPDFDFNHQPLILLHTSPLNEVMQQYRDALAATGIRLSELEQPAELQTLLPEGCHVGVLLVSSERDLERLSDYEEVLGNGRLCWVGLITKDLIGKAQVRRFIADHLFNFVTLPAPLEDIILTLRHAWGMAFMRQCHPTPNPEALAQNEAQPLLGSSPPIQQLRAQILKIARTDAPVLIQGPSGSGKKTVAREIHQRSPRANGPFVALNCAGDAAQNLPSSLFKSDNLADSPHAQGGTLFLEAVNELPPEAQAGLLHLLDDTLTEANVRVVAASRVDLAAAVRHGRFREDLYYRLNVMGLTTPTLNECGCDVEVLARHYFGKFASRHNRSLRGFSRAAMHALLAHPWPGNVRELINRIQRAVTVAESRFVQPEDLGLERPRDAARSLSLEQARAATERAMIQRALAQSRNQISRAATLLGVSRVTLYRLIEKYNLRPNGSVTVPVPFHPQPNSERRAHR